jgi:urea transport system ATP-binding protein
MFRLDSEQSDRIDGVMATVGLSERASAKAGALSHGQKQWLEIGMLLMQDQRLLLLDEPVAGLSDAETAATAELILDLARDHTRSLVVVEHDMEFVRSLGAKVTVLHEGSVLAEGSIDTVQNDHRVIEVYLGR